MPAPPAAQTHRLQPASTNNTSELTQSHISQHFSSHINHTNNVADITTDLGFGFGKLPGATDDRNEGVVDILVGELVDEAGLVLQEFAHRFIAVRQQRQTQRQVSPLSVDPTAGREQAIFVKYRNIK